MDEPVKYTNNQINKAGLSLVQNPADGAALKFINNWREAHILPMDIVFNNIKNMSNDFVGNVVVAERLKRLPTIVDKIRRYPTMRLSSMQDIAGVRVIFPDVVDAYTFIERAAKFTDCYHMIKDPTDYIASPKPDGYRGIHIIYEFGETGLFVELQIRSAIQHIWATAIESMSVYLDEPFKTGGGEKEWREFFALVSSAFAYFEDKKPVKSYEKIGLSGIYANIEKLDVKLSALKTIRSFADAGERTLKLRRKPFLSHHRHEYALISLDLNTKKTKINFISKKDSIKAMRAYEELEKRGERYDQVLVSVAKMAELSEAYPNYFLKLKEFADSIEDMISEYKRHVV